METVELKMYQKENLINTWSLKLASKHQVLIEYEKQIIILVEGESDRIIFQKYIEYLNLEECFKIEVANGICKMQMAIKELIMRKPEHKIIVIWDEDRRNHHSDITKNKIKYHYQNQDLQNYERIYFSELKQGALEDYYSGLFPEETKVCAASKISNHQQMQNICELLTQEDILFLQDEKMNAEIMTLQRKNIKLKIDQFELKLPEAIDVLEIKNQRHEIKVNQIIKVVKQ